MTSMWKSSVGWKSESRFCRLIKINYLTTKWHLHRSKDYWKVLVVSGPCRRKTILYLLKTREKKSLVTSINRWSKRSIQRRIGKPRVDSALRSLRLETHKLTWKWWNAPCLILTVWWWKRLRTSSFRALLSVVQSSSTQLSGRSAIKIRWVLRPRTNLLRS